jgi:hypothetical protein
MRHSDVTPAAEAETVDALLQDVNSLKQKDLLLADQIDQLHRQYVCHMFSVERFSSFIVSHVCKFCLLKLVLTIHVWHLQPN